MEPNESEKPPELLHVFCIDKVDVCDRVTFTSYLYKGLWITYWHEEAEDEWERVNQMFRVLFEEVQRRRAEKALTHNKYFIYEETKTEGQHISSSVRSDQSGYGRCD